MPLQWNNPATIAPRGYRCGYCKRSVGPNMGYFTSGTHQNLQCFIYICSYCGKPTYFEPDGTQFPGIPFGNDVESVPQDVASLYAEARSSVAVNAFTAAVLT